MSAEPAGPRTSSAGFRPSAVYGASFLFLLAFPAYLAALSVADGDWAFVVNAVIYAFAAPLLVTGELWTVHVIGRHEPRRSRLGIWIGGTIGVLLGSAMGALAGLLIALYPWALLFNLIFVAITAGSGVLAGFLIGRGLDSLPGGSHTRTSRT